MNPARFALRQSRAVLLVTGLLVLAGAIASFSLPSSIYPPLQFPRIAVIAHAGTTPAATMTLTVARPLEQALMQVPGVRRVRSRTFRGATEIFAQFEPATDMIQALQQAQSYIAEIRGDLPSDTELFVDRLTPAAFPIYSLNLSGPLPPADLNDYAFYVIRPALARVSGVGRVEVQSSDTREIEVIVDPAKMLAAKLTVEDVAAALKGANLLEPVGRYPENGQFHLAVASGLWDSASQIGDTPVVVKAGATLRVRDLATVTPGAPDRTMLVVGEGGPSTSINVSQQIGANILTIRRGLEDALAQLVQTLPAGLKITKTYDLAAFVQTAIANVRDAIVVGGLLAVLVLLAFLRNWRLTLVAASTLPITVVSTFFFMWLLGASINVMSMGGMAVAIGLVIDDAVVVVENIHRRLAEGGGTAAIEAATGELVGPVVGSTLTTVVVFTPLGLLQGVVGDFFKALSITLSVAVLISLALSLTLTPLLARMAYRPHADDRAHHEDRPGVLDRVYVRTLPLLFGRNVLVALVALVLAGAAAAGTSGWGRGFCPRLTRAAS